MKIALSLLFSLAIALALVIIIPLQSEDNIASAIPLIISWAIAVAAVFVALYEVLKRRSLDFYFFIQRVKLRFFSSKSAAQDFSVKFEFNTSSEVLKEIEDRMLETYVENISIVKTTSSRAIYTIRGQFNTEIAIVPPGLTRDTGGESDKLSRVYLHVLNLRVGYREGTAILEQELLPLANLIDNIIQPKSRSYSLVVNFKKTENPFLGLYLQRVRPENMERFEVIVSIDKYGEKDIVKVSETSICLLAYSPNAFQALATNFLSLSSALKEYLVPSH